MLRQQNLKFTEIFLVTEYKNVRRMMSGIHYGLILQTSCCDFSQNEALICS